VKNAIRENAYDVLRVVGLQPGIEATAIAEVVGMKSEYVREWLKSAEKAGLVYRKYVYLHNRWASIWHMNPVPFATLSDSRPSKQTPEERREAKRINDRNRRLRKIGLTP
jgi:hypothetical protein